MSFIDTLKITRKNRASVALVQGVSNHPFSYLLSPLKISTQLRSRSQSKQKYPEESFSATRYSRNYADNDNLPCFREKKRMPVKACTIDFGGKSREDSVQLRRRMSSSIKLKNGKSLKSKKAKAEQYSINPNATKYALNGSLEMRISSLGIRTGTIENEMETINVYQKKEKRVGSSKMSRDKQIRLMNSQVSKLREKQRARNIKSVILDDIKPWDSIGMFEQLI